jgi:hypothetical protein
MTTANGHSTDQVEGLVEAINDHGIRVAGEWRNVSKFHPVDLPDRGARVRVALDAKSFIKSVQVLDDAPSSAGSSLSSRDDTITRLSVLKTAASFVAQMGQVHEGVKSEHVIPLAERWLAWVEQEGGDRSV